MTDPTPTPTAPDWRALCKELRDAYQRSEDHPGDYFPFTDSLINRADAALATPPAPPLEPRGCPLPGACSCPTAPIVPPELIRALEMAAEALRVVDAGIVLADDMAGAQACAAKALPKVRYALQTWRDHSTQPAATREAGPEPDAALAALKLPKNWYQEFADWLEREMPEGTVIGDPLWWASRIADWLIAKATREAGPLPQAGAEISDEKLADIFAQGCRDGASDPDLPPFVAGARAVWARAVLARWGGAALPVPAANKGEGQP